MSQLPQSDSLLLCRIPRTSLLHLIISVGMVLSCHSLKSRTPNMWLTNTSVIYKSIWKSDNFSQSQGHKTSLKGCSQSWYSPQKKILMYKNVESVPLLIIEPLRFKEKKCFLERHHFQTHQPYKELTRPAVSIIENMRL